MTKKEQELAERRISLNSKKVYKKDLTHWLAIAAIRGSFYDRYKQG